jgi:hypothetical protein
MGSGQLATALTLAQSQGLLPGTCSSPSRLREADQCSPTAVRFSFGLGTLAWGSRTKWVT